MHVVKTLLVLAAASAQEPLLPAFVLAGRADLLPARAEATAAALREAVLARRPAVAVFLTAPGASAAAVASATAAGLAPAAAAVGAAARDPAATVPATRARSARRNGPAPRPPG